MFREQTNTSLFITAVPITRLFGTLMTSAVGGIHLPGSPYTHKKKCLSHKKGGGEAKKLKTV
jgi:hypothetical protein